ncbi:KamA family radical SAM protein [Pseudobacteriovorax antillogorgiicola]|uniref:L-lysine 2,3-aminomutase n=1 Tax=Pseudobacteriovorax antillogorgiicola TaxID=1513793 RepID=A0A1Y6CK62_9BACT|nr:KamA family radical SAM protein [Pseudobacteriovorax antillogorgiicola]TCS45840.1 L-lysine 2,3-aminomutase [Pseudobacteriovorax antillogorgiicola]SMF71856.1 L-lysine 2,3-aminomutase [Pseudobacteriovorax antillogorgiicola]
MSRELDSPFIPEEFLAIGQDPQSLTARSAERFGVSVETFINWRWQMKHQIAEKQQLHDVLDLKDQEDLGFEQLKDLFVTGITPYYAGLMAPRLEKAEDCPVRLQAMPRTEERFDSVGVADPLDEVPHSPVKEVVHVYPDRVAFCVAQLCPVYCRYCFRKRRDDEVGLHFNRQIVDRGIDYIASNPAIRDVLITGGDPFIASDAALDNLLSRIRAIPHVDIIRFGTRTPVTLPYRVTAKLGKILAKYHPVWLNTHFNCPEELTPEAQQAIRNLVDAGVPVGNQAVLLRGVNDSEDRMLTLCRQLLKSRVRPYYVFHPHAVEGTEHLRVDLRRGMKIMKSLRGNITGFGIPTYALDTPSGKIPIQHNYMLKEDGEDLIVETIRGEIWRERSVLTEL